ncbi:unnamed protein product, partial [Rotaria sp. Silwood2]
MATCNESSSIRRKLALIIGNGNYSRPQNRLTHPVMNANDLCDSLKKINFNVTTVIDLVKQEMLKRITEFSKAISDGDLILFYFSGHGYHVNGENYMIPIDDDNIKADCDFEDFAVNFQRTL